MNQSEMINKFSGLKGNIKNIFQEKLKRFLKDDQGEVILERSVDDEDDLPNDVDDLRLTITRETRPGIKFYTTENSPVAYGAEKEDAHGIDSFGEEDSPNIEEADDDHSNRDQKQNSNLSKRFYTGGMDLDDFNKH